MSRHSGLPFRDQLTGFRSKAGAPASPSALPARIRRWSTKFRERVERRWILTLDAACIALVPRRASGGRDVLVVRLDAIGDFVLWLDAARALRRLYDGRRTVLVANALCADLAARIGYWDDVWPVDLGRFKRPSLYRLRILARARRHGFEIAVQPTYSRVPMLGDVVVRASGAPDRVGSTGDVSNTTTDEKSRSDRSYTTLVAADPRPMMEIGRNAEFVARLTNAPFDAAVAVIPSLGTLPATLRFDGPYVVVFPGASVAYRQWPSRHFAEAADRLCTDSAATVVLCGSAAEKALCDEVAAMLSVPFHNVAGRTALWEFVEIVRGARLLIGNETSAVHVAAAVGTPSVCILGGGHYGRFMPYGDAIAAAQAPAAAVHPMSCFGCNWQCTQPHVPGEAVPCIGGVAVRDVIDLGREILSR